MAACPPATPKTTTRPVTRLVAARLASSVAPPTDSRTRSTPAPPVIRRDLAQPRAHRPPSLEPGVGTPAAQIGLLHHVLGIVDRAEHAVAVREQLAAERLRILDEVGAIGHCGEFRESSRTGRRRRQPRARPCS